MGLYNEVSLREREVDRIWNFATWPSRQSEFQGSQEDRKGSFKGDIVSLLGRPSPPASFHPWQNSQPFLGKSFPWLQIVSFALISKFLESWNVNSIGAPQQNTDSFYLNAQRLGVTGL